GYVLEVMRLRGGLELDDYVHGAIDMRGRVAEVASQLPVTSRESGRCQREQRGDGEPSRQGVQDWPCTTPAAECCLVERHFPRLRLQNQEPHTAEATTLATGFVRSELRVSPTTTAKLSTINNLFRRVILFAPGNLSCLLITYVSNRRTRM